MIASPPSVRPGHVRGEMSTRALRRVFRGEQSLEDARADGGTKPPQYVHYSQVAPGTLVGFVPYPEQPRAVIVARLPFTQRYVPAVWLSVGSEDWTADLEFVSRERLLRYEGVTLDADWLTHLLALATSLQSATIQKRGIDPALHTIGVAWERWETKGMPWKERAEDLARLTGLDEMTPNHLQVMCKRHGLVRSDNKASACHRR